MTLVNNLFVGGPGTGALFDTLDGNSAASGKRVGAAGMIPAAQQDYNGYYRVSAGTPSTLVKWYEVSGSSTLYPGLAAFGTGTGRDTHGRYQEGSNAYFVDAGAGDYRLVPGSAAETAGRALPADVAAAIGVPAAVPKPLGALLWPGRPTGPLSAPIYRLEHPAVGDQLLTASSGEADGAVANHGYVSHGVRFLAATSTSAGLEPVYRLRHPSTGDRLFTRLASERDSAVGNYGYTMEGIGFYAVATSGPGRIPVHCLQRGPLHHYAVGDAERDAAVAAGWRYESVVWHAMPVG